MSRVHSSVPAKSKAFRMPVPVITQTLSPSVTGEGEDMFCLRFCWLPPASGRCQSTVPFVRSTHHRYTPGPSATLRKMRSPQTIGVDPDQAGIASFHARPPVFDHRTGSPVSRLTPFSDGPRHCGQFSAASGSGLSRTTARSAMRGFLMRRSNQTDDGIRSFTIPRAPTDSSYSRQFSGRTLAGQGFGWRC